MISGLATDGFDIAPIHITSIPMMYGWVLYQTHLIAQTGRIFKTLF